MNETKIIKFEDSNLILKRNDVGYRIFHDGNVIVDANGYMCIDGFEDLMGKLFTLNPGEEIGITIRHYSKSINFEPVPISNITYPLYITPNGMGRKVKNSFIAVKFKESDEYFLVIKITDDSMYSLGHEIYSELQHVTWDILEHKDVFKGE